MGQNVKPRTQHLWRDRWEFVEPAGGGGQGTGFKLKRKGEQAGQPEYAFLKELRNQNRQQARLRMRNEATTLCSLHTPGVPRVIEHNTDDAEGQAPLYAILEHVDGPTLANRIAKDGPLDLSDAVDLLRALCEVLSHCHLRKICHRDIKGENIILRDGALTRPVIVDFGLSFNDEMDEGVTEADDQFRSRLIQLPEYTSGGAGRDPRSDVAQLVAVLFWVLTGERPWRWENGFGLPPHRRQAPQRKLRDLSGGLWPELKAVFERGFTKHPNGRFQSASTLAEALSRLDLKHVGRPLPDWRESIRDLSTTPIVPKPEYSPVSAPLVSAFSNAAGSAQVLAGEASGDRMCFTDWQQVSVSPVTVGLVSSMEYGDGPLFLDAQLAPSDTGLTVLVDCRYTGNSFIWSGDPREEEDANELRDEFGGFLATLYRP